MPRIGYNRLHIVSEAAFRRSNLQETCWLEAWSEQFSEESVMEVPVFSTICRNSSFVHRKEAYRCLCAIAFILFLLSPTYAITQTDSPKRLLVLHSYHPGMIWTESLSSGINQGIQESELDVQVHVEYMDTKYCKVDTIAAPLETLLLRKYSDNKPDVILTCDNNALGFLLQRRQRLFPGIPIVFCGINNFSPKMLAGHSNITGITENINIRQTITLMQSLHPDMRTVVAVAGEDFSAKLHLKQFREVKEEFRGKLEFRELSGLTLGELRHALTRLPEDSLVLYLTFYKDRDGKRLSLKQNKDLMTRICNRPVYSLWQEAVSLGVVGGVVCDGNTQGLQAAHLVARILSGESADQIAVVTQPQMKPTFNSKQMERFGIRHGQLPSNAIILGKSPSFFEQHKELILSAVCVMLVLGVLTCFLTLNIVLRKKAQKDLQRREKRFREVLEKSQDISYRLNLRTRTYDYISPSVEHIAGFSPEEIVCLGIEGVTARIHPDDLDSHTPETQLSQGPEEIRQQVTLRFRTKSEEYRWLSDNRTLLYDRHGTLKAVIGSARDITDQKNAEQTIRESQQRLQQLAEHIPQVFWVGCLQDRRTLYVSPAYETIWRLSPESLYENTFSWLDRVHPKDLQRVRSIFLNDEVTSRPEGILLEFRLLWPDEQTRWIRGHILPILNENNQPCRLVAIAEDITERKLAEFERQKLEMQVYHSQKLESLGILAGGIAHDFNNLLVGILGNAELALLDMHPNLPSNSFLEGIRKAAIRASELTNQMLAYSGKRTYTVASINLNDVTSEMTDLLNVSKSANIHLNYSLAPKLPAIKADVTQIRQIIMNLITNASDAIGQERGKISLTTGTMFADHSYLNESFLNDSLEQGTYVFLEVADTGCGMDEEVQARIFDPFFTTKFTGRGLGLAAVLGIIRSHRGAIRVISREGEGTTFRVLFPPCDTLAQNCLDSEEDRMSTQNGQGHILVIDDEQSVRNIMEVALMRKGFRVLTAEDGDEGIELFQQRKDDIRAVLLDMTMPRMSGQETFLRLRQIQPDVKVILCSGFDQHQATQAFTEDGLAGFLQKPFELEDLHKCVFDALEKN